MKVLAYTDTYLPTINGVSYTISEWRNKFDGEMEVVCPNHPDKDHQPDTDGVRSVKFPFYDNFRVALPKIRKKGEYDIVHAHTPFTLGLSGLLNSYRKEVPFVLSYHTPIKDYVSYIPLGGSVLSRIASAYQDRIFDRANRIIVPTSHIAEEVTNRTNTEVEVISNGVDTDFFRPIKNSSPEEFMSNYDKDLPTIGYAGRHGYEKNISLIIDELGDENINILIAGDGPACEELKNSAKDTRANIKFTGFLSRDNLPRFYSCLDLFAFPSPVETQGKVAIESMCCGTPVVGVNDGALLETIEDDVTGVISEPDNFKQNIMYVLENKDAFVENCIDKRSCFSVEDSVESLKKLYQELLNEHKESNDNNSKLAMRENK
jgi:glycosyltransferase involved in cell wall biosynthesis